MDSKIIIPSNIIEGCRQGLRSAQESLYKLCYADFMKVCLRYADSYDDAANILHDAFIKILTKMDSFKNSGDMVGWMRRIVINTNIDYIRAKKDQTHTSFDNIAEIAEENEEEGFVIDENSLLTIIRSLPPKQAAVFNLFVMESFSHDKIAEALDMTVASSKWHLFEARRILKEKVGSFLNQNGQK